jgi:hypothetical protein
MIKVTILVAALCVMLIIMIMYYDILTSNDDFYFFAPMLLGLISLAAYNLARHGGNVTKYQGGAEKKLKKSKKVKENNAKDDKTVYAYVWCLLSEEELPQLLVSAHSIYRTDTSNDLIVLVTENISLDARETIANLAKVIEVPIIEYKIKTKLNVRPNDKISFTKWNCINLVDYNKILLIDNGAIILDNIDHLFDLRAPAACFEASGEKNIISIIKGKRGANRQLEHGAKIHNKGIEAALIHKANTVSSALIRPSIVLLIPSNADFVLFKQTMSKMSPIGFPGCSSNAADQIMCYFYAVTKNYHFGNISSRYATTTAKLNSYDVTNFPYIIQVDKNISSWNIMAQDAKKVHKFSEGDLKLDDAKIAEDDFIKTFGDIFKDCLKVKGKLKPSKPLFVQPEPYTGSLKTDTGSLKTDTSSLNTDVDKIEQKNTVEEPENTVEEPENIVEERENIDKPQGINNKFEL